MPDVVLLYEASCPNVGVARANLARALVETGLGGSWRELDVDGPNTPATWRVMGSPTVLVDGVDVADGTAAAGATCRLYEEQGRTVRAPSVERLVARLRAHATKSEASVACSSSSARSLAPLAAGGLLATFPGLGVALLPNVLCPACWPAYAALLSPLGLSFLMRSQYLLPLTMALLVVATFAIGFRARARRGYGPAVLAAISATVLLVAKFGLDASFAVFAATGAFAAAAVWNAWPVRRSTACATCVAGSSQPS